MSFNTAFTVDNDLHWRWFIRHIQQACRNRIYSPFFDYFRRLAVGHVDAWRHGASAATRNSLRTFPDMFCLFVGVRGACVVAYWINIARHLFTCTLYYHSASSVLLSYLGSRACSFPAIAGMLYFATSLRLSFDNSGDVTFHRHKKANGSAATGCRNCVRTYWFGTRIARRVTCWL